MSKSVTVLFGQTNPMAVALHKNFSGLDRFFFLKRLPPLGVRDGVCPVGQSHCQGTKLMVGKFKFWFGQFS